MSGHDDHIKDAMLYGVGYLKDGKRIMPQDMLTTMNEFWAANRATRRRENAAAVMEEATAILAAQCQHLCAEHYNWETDDEDLRTYSRLARRYLFALVGDGSPEEIPEHWLK